MDDYNFVLGLMRHNYDALGFIPAPTIASRYLPLGRYIIQRQRTGRPVGYILHGKPAPGGVLTIAQAVIEYDHRERGHGMDAVATLIERAQQANCRAIVLGCAGDLPANAFWRAAGFEQTAVLHPENKRNRAKNIYTLDLWPTLFQ